MAPCRHAQIATALRPRPEPGLRSRAERFARISAVEGVALTDEMRATLERFDREGLSADERRRAILARFATAVEEGSESVPDRTPGIPSAMTRRRQRPADIPSGLAKPRGPGARHRPGEGAARSGAPGRPAVRGRSCRPASPNGFSISSRAGRSPVRPTRPSSCSAFSATSSRTPTCAGRF